MEMVTEYLQSVIPLVLTVIIQAIVAVGGVFLIRLIRKLLKKTGIEIDQKTMDDIEDIILKAVTVTNQILTDGYKEASKNHKLTDEQKKEVFEHTKAIVMASLSSEQIQALVKKFGIDGEDAVDLLIENTVHWNHSDYLVSSTLESK